MRKEIAVLLIISILLGSGVASAVSLTANAYFSKTLANLVGDSGEYDVIITVREEMKEESAEHIQKIIQESMPEAKMKEGPTLTGKTSFFIALPESLKTKQTYDNLNKIFGSIPGGASVGVLTEPRLTIRGVPDGAKKLVADQIAKIDGVQFVFNDGASIGVILTSPEKNATVTKDIKNLLDQYQVIEVSFPVGSEPANPIRTGDAIARDMEQSLKLTLAQNVSVDGKNDDMTYLVSTMLEMKRFLSAYASQVVVSSGGGVSYHPGDTIAFQGISALAPVNGAPVDKQNVVATVTAVRSDGTAEVSITQGDVTELMNPQGYLVSQNAIGAAVGQASYRSPRQELGNALTETGKVVAEVPGLLQSGQSMSRIAYGTLDQYSSALGRFDQALSAIQSAGATIDSAAQGLSDVNTDSLASQLDHSAKALGPVLNTLQVVKLLNGDVNQSLDSVAATQQGLLSAKNTVSAIGSLAGQAQAARAAADNVTAKGSAALSTLHAFDVNGARSGLDQASSHMNAVQGMNIPLIASQLQILSAAAPNLRDDEMTHSLALLDKFIAGQVIPAARIQLLTTNNIASDAVTPLVAQAVGHNNFSVYSTALGVIEPDPRGQMMSVLSEVRAILAAMTSFVLTGVFLALDHTAVMAALKRQERLRALPRRKWQVSRYKGYGMVCGALLLTSMFLLSRGGIPYLPWPAVPVCGALWGFLIACYAEKINPVSVDEMLAGEALGLSFDEIVREIVIPAGRPGLMQKLNQRLLQFR